MQAVADRPTQSGDPELARARDGDVDAFVALIHRHDTEMRALAYRILGERHAMDDALQEAYTRAFKALRSFRGGSSLRTWLYRIVYNACIDELRRSRRDVPVVEEVVAAENVDRAAIARIDLAAALAALPVDLRAIVLLVDAGGLDYAEAAEVLGIPPGTVGSRLHRARVALRGALGKELETL